MLDCATQSAKEAATLSRDRSVMELVAVKAFKQPTVVSGLRHFLTAEGEGLADEANVERTREVITWGTKVILDSLSAGEGLVE